MRGLTAMAMATATATCENQIKQQHLGVANEVLLLQRSKVGKVWATTAHCDKCRQSQQCHSGRFGLCASQRLDNSMGNCKALKEFPTSPRGRKGTKLKKRATVKH